MKDKFNYTTEHFPENPENDDPDKSVTHELKEIHKTSLFIKDYEDQYMREASVIATISTYRVMDHFD